MSFAIHLEYVDLASMYLWRQALSQTSYFEDLPGRIVNPWSV